MQVKVYLNGTFEIVSAASKEEAIRKAVDLYRKTHMHVPEVIEVEGLEVIK